MTVKHPAVPDEPPVSFDLVRRPPSARIAPLVSGITGYLETACGHYRQREIAVLCVPLIISLGSAFRIALGRDPEAADRQPSFAAGLFPGPVHIESDGAAECVQIDFTPLGAYRFFGGAVTELVSRMVDIEAVLGPAGRTLHQCLGEARTWYRRFDILEDFIAGRLAYMPSREVDYIYRRLHRAGGNVRLSRLAAELGRSRKHVVTRFSSQIGVAPKTVARMMRFDRACALARTAPAMGWAGVAAEAGYCDQAHLVREFGEFAGESPTAWARRVALTDERLLRSVAT